MAQSDSWSKEFEEAMLLTDDILARLNERNVMISSGANPSRLVSETRRTITALGTKLDGLESQLKSPPMKSSITEREMYRRQDMVLGVRFRAKQMNAALGIGQVSNRANLLSQEERSDPSKETDKLVHNSVRDSPVIDVQKQVMKQQQDEDLGGKSGVTSTKHVAVTVHEELNLHNCLLDATDRKSQEACNPLKLGIVNKNAHRICSFMCMCLMMFAIVMLVVIAVSLFVFV